ncbi:MAG: FAD-dependent oxidoreductase [Chitinispirillales bacterium]|jgi:NAD(P)H-nitrite reductase large subunit|nr:FAD-dependent oxidoreductase [Chitinispirillales bacterium]
MKYVIIGNSAAGIGAVEGIRQADKKGEVTVVASEPHHTYSRPLISYLLLGKTSEEKMKYRGDGFYKENGCDLLAGVSVKEINSGKKSVALDNGKSISYDKLLVATGSTAFVPPFEGLDTVKDKCTFMSLDDARQLEGYLGAEKRVLIIGAGLIGLKCAEGIAGSVSHITVIDLAPRILSSILNDDGAKIVQNHIESRGVEFRLAASVKRFEKDTAILDSGETIGFDILVLAVGVRPNTSLLKDIAKIDKGIIIDAKSKTTAADIYAAGDCTQTLDISSGQNRIMALLPNAYMQGECAGINMAGGEKEFDKAIPMNAIGFFGLHVITAGNYTGDVYSETENTNYKRLFYSGNKLNGYIMIGNVEKAGIYTSLIKEQTPLDSIDFALVCERPGLMAFTKEDRQIKLGGKAK